jgi:hypothetical protein
LARLLLAILASLYLRRGAVGGTYITQRCPDQ